MLLKSVNVLPIKVRIESDYNQMRNSEYIENHLKNTYSDT